MPGIAIILPPTEMFSPGCAGAIGLVARRFAAAAGATVFGGPNPAPFPGIAYHPVRSKLALIAALYRLRPAVIEVHRKAWLALLLALLMPRSRVMLFLHNDPLDSNGLRRPAQRRLMLSRLHRVICVSAYLRDRYMTGLTGPGPSVLPNPLGLAELPPPPPQRAAMILYAGRVTADKGTDIFTAACALALPQLPGWTARIIGGDRAGPNSPETEFVRRIRGQAAAAGIEYAGNAPHIEVLTAMAAAAIAVVPSRWAEPFGLSALEALASGTPLIATRQGGLPEVAGAAAVYVPADDAPALAAALVALAGDPQHRAELATAGRARAAKFDTPVIAQALEALRAAPPGPQIAC